MLLNLQSFNVIAQNNILINYGDSIFMEKNTYLDNSISPFWDLKANLPKGNYLVVKKSLCGIDTLIRASFSKDGIKDGVWTKWEIRDCILEQEVSTNKVLDKFWSDARNKWKEIHYKNNFIVKHKTFHFGSDIIHSELLYTNNATQINEWNTQKLFSVKGKIERETSYTEDGQIEYKEFFNNGNVSSHGKYGLLQEVIEDWCYYYKDGTLKAKGRYTEYTESLGRPTLDLIENGIWKYYNSKGSLVAEINFQLGQVLNYTKYLDEKISMPGIEELINKMR